MIEAYNVQNEKLTVFVKKYKVLLMRLIQRPNWLFFLSNAAMSLSSNLIVSPAALVAKIFEPK